jgi:hypothetical protein
MALRIAIACGDSTWKSLDFWAICLLQRVAVMITV